jgi:hypothetical protein
VNRGEIGFRRTDAKEGNGTLLVVGCLAMAVGAAQQQEAAGRSGRTGGPPSADALQVETLSDKLFVLRGGGGSGNTVAFITANASRSSTPNCLAGGNRSSTS